MKKNKNFILRISKAYCSLFILFIVFLNLNSCKSDKKNIVWTAKIEPTDICNINVVTPGLTLLSSSNIIYTSLYGTVAAPVLTNENNLINMQEFVNAFKDYMVKSGQAYKFDEGQVLKMGNYSYPVICLFDYTDGANTHKKIYLCNLKWTAVISKDSSKISNQDFALHFTSLEIEEGFDSWKEFSENNKAEPFYKLLVGRKDLTIENY